jgi:hypothetical protein
VPEGGTEKNCEEAGTELEEEPEIGLSGIKDLVGCVATATPWESIELLCQVGKSSINRLGSIGNS